jgi:hypothetical protein
VRTHPPLFTLKPLPNGSDFLLLRLYQSAHQMGDVPSLPTTHNAGAPSLSCFPCRDRTGISASMHHLPRFRP